MKYNKIAGIILCTAGMIFLASCAKNNSPVATQNTDQSYFESVMNGNDPQTSDLMTSDYAALDDEAMYSVAMGSQPVTPQIQSITADTGITPLKWGRFITGVSRSITSIDTSGDSVAIVYIQVVFTGNYEIYGIVAGTNDTELVKKPYVETLQRSLRFIRISHGNDPFFNWKLDAVTILNGGTQNSDITITKVQVIPPSGDTLSVTDPNSYYMEVAWRWMHRLPLWGWNTQVTVNVTLHSTSVDTDIVALHYVPRNFGLHRQDMSLVSSAPDSTGYTRVYSLTFTIPGNDKKFSHVF